MLVVIDVIDDIAANCRRTATRGQAARASQIDPFPRCATMARAKDRGGPPKPPRKEKKTRMPSHPSRAAGARRSGARLTAWPLAALLLAANAGIRPGPVLAQEAAPQGPEPSAPAAPPAEADAAAPAAAVAAEAPPAAPEAQPATEAQAAAAAPQGAPPPPDLPALIADPALDARSRLELEVLALVNQRRAEHGLAPLVLDNRLVASAREHAVDMALGHFCRHQGRDGTRARDRMQRNGYPFNNWAGENIICSRRSAEAMVHWWMQSPPHRRNILHAHFRHVGVGISMKGRYGPDAVLNFATGAAEAVEADVFRSRREGRLAEWVAATGEQP